ncbi:hypothetical protein Pmani_033175 [Petrolisthes manimaculis]|uniref:Uncharacterized protein n=1 Tax=Petrolisthes manimaculis TaxID=1843537 RepID=A0AAE1NRK4_9EUCA|nr:hypothetical protein Pmani_033175 [Petrolisthes manimaculis]
MIRSPSFKFSRKASSSYSLKLEPVKGGVGAGQRKGRKKPVSTPASPSRTREPQCTCMTAEQYARLRAQDPRYREDNEQADHSLTSECNSYCNELTLREKSANRNVKLAEVLEQGQSDVFRTARDSPPEVYDNLHFGKSASTLPRTQGGRGVVEGPASRPANHGATHTTAATTNTTQAAMCDTMTSRRGADSYSTMKLAGNSRDLRQPPSHHASHASLHHKGGGGVGTLTRKEELSAATAAAAAATATSTANETGGSGARDNRSLRSSRRELSSKSVDYSEMDTVRETDTLRRRARSKSTDDVTKGDRDDASLNFDSNILKRMLKPMPSGESPGTSPESWHHRGHGERGIDPIIHRSLSRGGSTVSFIDGFNSEPESGHPHRLTPSRSAMSVLDGEGGGGCRRGRGFRLDLGERESPPSDRQLFDLACYATTPSSSRPACRALVPNTSSQWSFMAGVGPPLPPVLPTSILCAHPAVPPRLAGPQPTRATASPNHGVGQSSGPTPWFLGGRGPRPCPLTHS